MYPPGLYFPRLAATRAVLRSVGAARASLCVTRVQLLVASIQVSLSADVFLKVKCRTSLTSETHRKCGVTYSVWTWGTSHWGYTLYPAVTRRGVHAETSVSEWLVGAHQPLDGATDPLWTKMAGELISALAKLRIDFCLRHRLFPARL